MGKIILNSDNCIGCGACVAINPENFDFNEEGLSKVINEEACEKSLDALEACPVCAIEIEGCDDCCCDNCNCDGNHECNCDDDCNCGEDCNCGKDCKCNK